MVNKNTSKNLFIGILSGLVLLSSSNFSYTSATATNNNSEIDIKVGQNEYRFSLCADNILKVHYVPNKKTSKNTVVIGDNVIKNINIDSTEQGDNIIVKTDKMKVIVNKINYSFCVYDALGKKLITSDKLSNKSASFTHNKYDNFYGVNGYDAWEKSTSYLLKPMNKTIPIKAGMQGYCGGPFIWSTGGYGVLVDTDGGKLSLSKDKINFSNISKNDIEYYIIVGTPKEILSGLSSISGKTPMFPKWAMGFTNSEWGIDEPELTNIVNTYRKKNIPIDNYTLDFDWKNWGANNYGDFKWDTVNFPDGPSGKLKKMMDSKGIKLTGILKPRIHLDKVQGEYATKHNFWYPNKDPYIDYFSGDVVKDLNFALPACRTWFFDNLKKSFDTGIIGWWNDEADDGFDNDEFLNMERALYEGQRNYSKLRVWSLNRNFYLGSQRYAYGMWSGDINTGFTSMAMQRERLLSASDLGVTKWGMDSGGFKGTPSPENYARWIEFSAFVPEFRVHGDRNEQRQPWVYGATAEKAAKNAMQLRYKLIPYIYSYERAAYDSGVSISRPLVFDYPTDKNVANYVDAWMFGDYLLVSPVVDEGQKSKKIYLPAGKWIDYFTGKTYDGNKYIQYKVNNKTWGDIPLFIKEGAIIPSEDVLNYVGEKPVTNVYVDIFPSKQKTTFNYYDDDGKTYSYEKGSYFMQNMSSIETNDSVKFEIETPTGTYSPETKYYILKIHTNKQNVSLEGTDSLKKYTSYNELLKSTDEGYTTGKDTYGNLIYVKVNTKQYKNITLK